MGRHLRMRPAEPDVGGVYRRMYALILQVIEIGADSSRTGGGETHHVGADDVAGSKIGGIFRIIAAIEDIPALAEVVMVGGGREIAVVFKNQHGPVRRGRLAKYCMLTSVDA